MRAITHTRRQAATSVFLVAFLAVVVSANVPVRAFHDAVRHVDDPVLAALGPRQVWNVFAPDPPQTVGFVAVRFAYRDGTSSTWRIPRGPGALGGDYRNYRWLKLGDNVITSDAAATGLLLWAIRARAEPKPLAHADLVRLIYDVAPIGRPRGAHAAPRTAVLFSVRPGG